MDRGAWVGALGSSGRPRAQGPTRGLADGVPGGRPTDSNPKEDSETVLVAQPRPSKLRWRRPPRRYTHRADSKPVALGWLQVLKQPRELAPGPLSRGEQRSGEDTRRSLPPQSDRREQTRSPGGGRQGTAPPTQGRGGRHAHPEAACDSVLVPLRHRLGPTCLPRKLAQ